jgi:hypothetical protein
MIPKTPNRSGGRSSVGWTARIVVNNDRIPSSQLYPRTDDALIRRAKWFFGEFFRPRPANVGNMQQVENFLSPPHCGRKGLL